MTVGHRLLTTAAAAMLAASTADATAQVHATGTQPPRDRPPGTAVIKGRVVDAATGSPVARARVRLAGGLTRPVVHTDAGGRFAITGVSPGRWTLSVEKAPYSPAQYPEPGRTLRTASRQLTVTDGAVIDNLTVAMHRVSILAGRVLDTYGDPVDYATIRVMRVTGSPGAQGTMGMSTNELGEFRNRIQPGTYVLQAVPHDRGEDLTAGLRPLPTYYPGVPSIDQAHRITIRRGQSVSDLDIVLLEGTPAILTGIVIDTHGQPVNTGYVSARLVADGFSGWSIGTPIKPDGTFQLRATPGDYVLDAQGIQTSPESTRPEDRHSGSVRASLTGGTVDVVIRVGPPVTITGTIAFDGTGALPDPKQVQLHTTGGMEGPCRSGRTDVAADWTFTMTGLAGTCTIEGGGMSWRLRSVFIGRDDFAGRAIALETAANLRDVRVVLSDRPSGVTLRVADEHGQRTQEYVAIVFSTDKERWKRYGGYFRIHVPPSSELTLGARRDAQPQPGVPVPPTPPIERVEVVPGEYFVVAVEDIGVEDSRDTAVLERLIAHAVRVTVTDGAHVDVGLRRIKTF